MKNPRLCPGRQDCQGPSPSAHSTAPSPESLHWQPSPCSTHRQGFGIVSLSCHSPPLSLCGALDHEVSQPLAAASGVESPKLQGFPECWMPLWICNSCSWTPHKTMQSKLLQTKYMARMCWELAAWLEGMAREGGETRSAFSLCVQLGNAWDPLKDFNMALEGKSWRRFSCKKLDGDWRVQRAWE